MSSETFFEEEKLFFIMVSLCRVVVSNAMEFNELAVSEHLTNAFALAFY